MKKLVYILLLFVVASCNDFLDINPKSIIVNDDLFKNDEGFQDALYGVYASMGESNLYGKALSIEYVELCAQNLYSINVSLKYKAFSKLDFVDSDASSHIKGIWEEMYEKIGYVNNILQNLEKKSKGDLRYYNLYKGEALALRAAMHFDLLKLYAVNINSADAESLRRAIPYVKEYGYKITKFVSVEEVYNEIIADLKEAEKFLEEDKKNISYPRNPGGLYFADSRITHLNIYAVQALLARVYWQKYDMENAALYAKKVIDSDKFHFMVKTDLKNKLASVMSMEETIWGLYKYDFWEETQNVFGENTSHSLNLAPFFPFVYDVDPIIGKDYRIEWVRKATTGQPLLYKLYNVELIEKKDGEFYDDSNGYLGINMIRIPEMYLIMAEYFLDKNIEEATRYYDALITARGLIGLKERGEVLNKNIIMQERRKEFVGEGQEWYRMKRELENIEVFLTGETIQGSDVVYKWPYPDIEDERNK